MAVVAAAVPAMAQQDNHRRDGGDRNRQNHSRMAVTYPWVFSNGTDTARSTAMTTVEEIARRAGYAAVSNDSPRRDSSSNRYLDNRRLPSKAELGSLGREMHASKVIYGAISWHTRSIWVGAGPKTISTATVDAYVFDVDLNKVVYHARKVNGRSDEKANGYKLAADILLTPIVTAVSGGPATPQEQRAVQIALGKAYRNWVFSNNSRD